MNLAERLTEHGIRLNSYAGGNYKTRCPRCSESRKNSKDPCLSTTIDDDGARWKCHNCSWSGGVRDGDQRSGQVVQFRQQAPKKAVVIPAMGPLKWEHEEFLAARKLDLSVLSMAGVGCVKHWIPAKGAEVDCIAIPYRDVGGATVNVKFRTLDKEFAQIKGGKKLLFGWERVDPSDAMLVIAEGEFDALAMTQSGVTNATSVPDGASDRKWDFLDDKELSKFTRIVIAGDMDEKGQELAGELARRFGFERCFKVTWPEGCKDANDTLIKFDEAKIRECVDGAQPWPISGLHTFNDFEDDIWALYRGGRRRGVSTGWKSVDRYMTIRGGELSVVTGIPGHGKALALDTRIPTPSGFVEMRQIKPGDVVFDENGRRCNVIAATQIMYFHPCFELQFSDGSKITCDGDHEWVTRDNKARCSERNAAKNKRVSPRELKSRGSDQAHKRTFPSAKTTTEIARTLLANDGRINHAIAVGGAIDCEEKCLPINPYVLGVWLGDGSSYNASVHTIDRQVVEEICAAGHAVKKWRHGIQYGGAGLQASLRFLDLLENKHVPPEYLRASFNQRLALLQGLMDTDGYADKTGWCEFTSTTEALALNARELVSSLGIKSTIRSKIARLYGKDCGTVWTVCFTTRLPVFRLQRKLSRLKRSVVRLQKWRQVVDCRAVASVPVRCIQVDSPSHQYLCGETFIPTHNSEFIDALLVNLYRLHDWSFAVCSFENPPDEHFAKYAEKINGMPFHEGPSARMGDLDVVAALNVIRERFFLIRSENESPTIDWILDRARAAVLRHGVRGLVIDPYNEMEHQRPAGMNETEYVSYLLNKIKRFARNHDIHVWFVAHPAKPTRNKDGKYPDPSLYDISGSSNWSNKADLGVIVVRDFAKGSRKVTVHVKKVRFKAVGRPGAIDLEYDRLTGRYSEAAEEYPDRGWEPD